MEEPIKDLNATFESMGVEILSRNEYCELQRGINAFLLGHPNYKLIDVKFSTSYATNSGGMKYAAMIIYKIA